MTSEDFERILISVLQMKVVNLIPEGYHVSMAGVLKIIFSQLPPDERAKWEFKDGYFYKVAR